MIVEVDTSSAVPPYEQIRGQIATMIASGVLGPGTPLPTIRQLAADLGLAANTVARAYRELEGEGLVISRVRHGTTVADRGRLPRDEIREQLRRAARTYAGIARQLGVPPEDAAAVVGEALTGPAAS